MLKSLLLKEDVFGKSKQLFTYLLLFACTEAVFLNENLELILGPVLAVLLCYIYFKLKDKVFISFYVVIANDALATIFMDRISMWWVLALFIIVDFTHVKNKICMRQMSLFIIATFMALQPAFTGLVGLNSTIATLLYLYILLMQFFNSEKQYFLSRMMVSISVIVCLIALHTVITGGVTYSEDADTMIDLVIRRGILGVGRADANFSSLLLCTGMACTLCNQSFGKLLKIIIGVLILGAMTVTMSTTGFLCIILVVLLSLLINSNFSRWVNKLILFLVGIIFLFSFYSNLPDNQRNPNIDAYVERMEGKYLSLVAGDMTDFTTNRSDLSERYMNYINHEQTLLGVIFGFNNIQIYDLAPHNTYIDFLLQFGYLGTFLILLYWSYRIQICYKQSHDNNRKISLILKALFIFCIYSLSVYNQSIFALMFLFLFIL